MPHLSKALLAGANYVQVVTDAVDEIEGHHSFVTEYAGPSNIMVDVLDYQGRFGNLAELAAKTDAIDFVGYMNNTGYPLFGNNGPNGFSPTYASQILNILQSHLPVPSKLLAEDITPAEYYWNISYYLGQYRQENPEKFEDLDVTFVPQEVADQLQERVVDPTLEAGQIFRDHDYLSRLFTTLSPNEMTKDPVFSFNPNLPEVSNVHSGTITYYCDLVADPTAANTPAVLYTEQGFKLVYSNGVGDTDAENPYADVDMPQSQFQELLREEGDAVVVVDNTQLIRSALRSARGADSGGCSSTGTGAGTSGLLLLGLALLALRRRQEQ